jgi:capsular polysaccharide transport system ATP-binding protein
MIRLDNVSKYFATPSGRKYVLKNLDLELPDAVNIGVLGLNGSGKSTLLRLIEVLISLAKDRLIFKGLSHGQWA